MAYSLELSDGSTVEFDDGVPTEKAVEMARVQFPDLAGREPVAPPTMDVVRAIPGETKRQFVQPLVGLARIAEDVTGVDLGSKEAQKGIALERQDETPKNMTMLQEGLYSGVASIPQSAVGLAAGLATGGLAAPLTYMGANAALGEYPEQREGGMTPVRAAGHSLVAGLAEAGGEMLPMKTAISKGMFWPTLKKYVVQDIGGEMATQIAQSANRKLSIQPDMTMGEFLRDVGVAGIAGGVGAAVQGPVVAGASHLLGGHEVSLPVPEAVVRQVRARAFAKALDEEVARGPVDEAGLVDTGKRAGWAESADKIRELLKMPEGLYSDIRPEYTERMDVAAIPKMPEGWQGPDAVVPSETQWVHQQVEDTIAAGPSVADKFVLRNIKEIAEAGVDLPLTIKTLVETNRLPAERGTQILNRVESALTNIIQQQEAAVTQVEAKYQQESAAYAPGVNERDVTAGTALDEDRQLFAGLMQQVDAGTLSLLGAPHEVAQRLEQLGVAKKVAQTIGKEPAQSRVRALEQVVKFATDMGTWTRSEPHTGMTTYEAIHTNYGDEVLGKVVTFGPSRGSRVAMGAFQPRHVNVINEENLDAKSVRRIYGVVSGWTKRFLPSMNVVVHIRPPVGKGGKRVLGHMRILRDGGGKLVGVEIATTAGEGVERTINTLAHEFGHAMFVKHFDDASPEMKEALWQHYRADIAKGWSLPIDEFLDRQRGPLVGAHSVSDESLGVRLLRAVVDGQVYEEKNATVNYWPNFWEWHAHNMERMLLENYGGMTDIVQRFWKTAYDAVAKFFNVAHSQWDPQQTLAEWLRISAEYERGRVREVGKLEVTKGQVRDVGMEPVRQTPPTPFAPPAVDPIAEVTTAQLSRVEVKTSVYNEKTKRFSRKVVPADEALAAVDADISAYKQLIACLGG